MNAENCHTVTPQGWTHERGNTKTIRRDVKTLKKLPREFGLNHHQCIKDGDFKWAYDYWQQVWAVWKECLENPQMVLKTKVDGIVIIQLIFSDADAYIDKPENTKANPRQTDIQHILN